MKIVLQGVAYDASRQPFIGDLRLLKAEFGFGWGTVVDRMSGMTSKNLIELLDDVDFVEALTAFMWMTKLRAGERATTRADVEMIPLDEITFDGDDEPAAEPESPTEAPTDSRPAAGARTEAAATARTTTSSRTSKPRSTTASR